MPRANASPLYCRCVLLLWAIKAGNLWSSLSTLSM